MNGKPGRAGQLLLTTAALVIVLAGIKTAGSIVVPFLVAVFIAAISSPPMFWLKRKGVPTALALLIVLSAVIGLVVLLMGLVGKSWEDFTQAMPAYQERLADKTAQVLGWVEGRGIDIPDEALTDALDAGAVMRFANTMVAGFTKLLSNAMLILFTVGFMLFEASSIPIKLRAILSDAESAKPRFDLFLSNLRRYLAIKSMTSMATGALVALWLYILGVDFPLLWGLLAFLFNFVPTIGSILAAIPAVLLALVQFDASMALLVALGYVAVNISFGNLIEPRIMGQRMGLSTLIVFLSLVFWGWLLGPVGMLLSVPLTMTLKIALESSEETRWIAVLLGTETDAQSAALTSMQPTGEDTVTAELATSSQNEPS